MIVFDYAKTTRKLIIKCEDTNIFSNLREHFSVEDKNASFIQKRFKYRGFKSPSRKYVITPTGLSDLGLYWEVRSYLITNQITNNIVITPALEKALNIGIKNKVFTEFSLELRDYQKDVLQKALNKGWGTCVLGTGAGKTLTTAALIENFYRNSSNKETFKCLMVVPDLGLVEQTYNEFVNYGITFKTTKWTGSNKVDTTSNVIICNIQILQSQIQTNDWVKFVDLLVVDECHRVKSSNKISKIISSIKTGNRFGFTGTLPQEQIEQWFIVGKLGPVLYTKNSFDLRIENYLTNVEVKIFNLQYNNVVIPKLTDSNYRNELDYIYNHEKRNNLITKIADKLTNNTLILVNHIVHGEALFNSLNNLCLNKKIFFIRGEVEVEERERIKTVMEQNNDVICVAISAIFSTGVNIKNLHNIMFVSGGKSFIRTVQSIGRGLRLHANKNKLLIIDICDSLNYSKAHSDKRKQIYNAEKIQYTEKNIAI